MKPDACTPTGRAAFQHALGAMERARALTLFHGHPPTRWALTMLWARAPARSLPLPSARTLRSLVRHVLSVRGELQPDWVYVVGKIDYHSKKATRPHLVCVLCGGGPIVLLHAEMDSDGNPGPTRVRVDPEPELLGPLRLLSSRVV